MDTPKIKLEQAPVQVTEKFKKFMKDILRYRCLLKESVIEKCFNKPESWNILHRSFIHKSMGSNCLELQEFHGDVVANLCVVEYIREEFKEVTSIDWNSGFKITFVSGHFLSKTAIEYGFWKYIVFSQETLDFFNYQQSPFEHNEFVKSNEDAFEAVCGAITSILNSHMTRGTGYNACFNMVKSFLDNSDEVIAIKKLMKAKDYQSVYNKLINAKTRLKETFDQQKWQGPYMCSIKSNLILYNISENQVANTRPARELALNTYKRDALKSGLPIDLSILTSTKNFLVLGYSCDASGSLESRVLVSAKVSNDKTSSQIAAAEEVINDLKTKGIFKKHTDPFR